MSGVVALVHRDGRPIESNLFERVLAKLDHRGPGGRSVSIGESVALGYQHLATMNEGQTCSQPVVDREAGIELVFDGRLDNRSELLRELGVKPRLWEETVDARIVLLAYQCWREECLARFLGPFALVVHDPQPGRVLVGRDPLGDRSLCYFLSASELVVASEPVAVLAHPSVSASLDEGSLARFFAVEPPARGRTFFEDVREIPPGHLLIVDRERSRCKRYWPPEDLTSLDPGTDEQRIELFRSTLVDAVRSRLRGTTRAHVLMSGGLDSTSVAAIASRESSAVAISWVFDELEEADERPFMETMVRECELRWHAIVGDQEWPLRDLESWPVDLNAPWQGPYCRLQNAAYRTAAENGESALLTGELGDHLYLGGELFWLRDLVREGRRAEAWSHLRRELEGQPLWNLVRSGRTRSALARAAGWRGRERRRAPWLTRYAQDLRGRESDFEPGFDCHPFARPEIVEPSAAHAASLETANAARHGIEVRRPFRDRRLVELMLSLPAHLSYRPGCSKYILRQAMTGLLPEPVRRRRLRSSLIGLMARGLVEREGAAVEGLLRADRAPWRRFVREDWLFESFPRRLVAGIDGVEAVVAWQCLCAGLWLERRGR